MADKLETSFKCTACNSKIEWDSEAKDDDVIVCPGCGAPVATFGELKARAHQKAVEYARKLADDFRRKLKR